MPLNRLLHRLRQLFGELPRPVRTSGPRVKLARASNGVKAFTRKGVRGRVEVGEASTDILFDIGPGFQGSLHAAGLGLGPLSKLDGRIAYGESSGNLAVVATHKSLVERLMTPKAREVLASFMARRKVLWRVSPAGFLLRVYARPKAADRVETWVSAAGLLVDIVFDLMGGPPARIEVTELRVAVAADTPCQICGSALSRGARVECGRCRTPHHRECWDFNGRCSTFGCGSTAFA